MSSMSYESIFSDRGLSPMEAVSPSSSDHFHEVRSSDIYIMIIGGSTAMLIPDSIRGNEDKEAELTKRYEETVSKEFSIAMELDKPSFVLIDHSVYAEYATFRRNRNNSTIKYAHVDRNSIFVLIDNLAQVTKSHLFQFERTTEVHEWLRIQLSSLFHDLLSRRPTALSAVTSQLNELAELNKTTKRYLEQVVSATPNGKQMIADESKRLVDAKFAASDFVKHVVKRYSIDPSIIKSAMRESSNEEAIIGEIARASVQPRVREELLDLLKTTPSIKRDLFLAKSILDTPV